MQDGTIRVTSEPGAGTTFTVGMPLAPGAARRLGRPRPAAARTRASMRMNTSRPRNGGWPTSTTATPRRAARSARPPADEAAAFAARGAAGARIVVADDNADLRDYMRRILGAAGYAVAVAADGQEALETARTFSPDLVVSDVMMPRLDGFGLLRALRADAALAQTPVLLLSARAGEEATVDGLEAGGRGTISSSPSRRARCWRGWPATCNLRGLRHETEKRLREEAHYPSRCSIARAPRSRPSSISTAPCRSSPTPRNRAHGRRLRRVLLQRAQRARRELHALRAVRRRARSVFEVSDAAQYVRVRADLPGEGILRCDDITRDARYGRNPPHHGMPVGHLPVRSYLAAPVISRTGEVLGGLFFGHPEPASSTCAPSGSSWASPRRPPPRSTTPASTATRSSRSRRAQRRKSRCAP